MALKANSSQHQTPEPLGFPRPHPSLIRDTPGRPSGTCLPVPCVLPAPQLTPRRQPWARAGHVGKQSPLSKARTREDESCSQQAGLFVIGGLYGAGSSYSREVLRDQGSWGQDKGGHGLEESAWRRRGWRRAGQRAGLPQEAGKGLAARHPPLPPHATPDFSQTLPLLNRGPTGGWAWPGDSFFTAPSGSEPCHLDTAGGCAPG